MKYGGKMSTCIEIYDALPSECFAARGYGSMQSRPNAGNKQVGVTW